MFNFPFNKKYDYDFCIKLKEEDYPKYLKKIYKQKTGKVLNLDNPKTFCEKIQWLKLYDNLPIKGVLADKIAVLDWIKDKIDSKHIKKIYQIGSYFDDINFDTLPDTFALKVNHASKMGYPCLSKKHKDFLLKNIDKCKKIFETYLDCNYAFACGFELQYKNIPHKIFAEEFVKPYSGSNYPRELEFYCFNGIPHVISLIKVNNPRIQINDIDVILFDENFKRLNYFFNPPPKGKTEQYRKNLIIELPDSSMLNKMTEYAKILSKNFKFVRVDFFYNNQNFYFAEMTFTPYSGFYNIQDQNFNKMLTDWLSL